MSRFAISLFLFAATACTSSSPKSSIDTADSGLASPSGTGTPPATSAGGCEWTGASWLYCYDFDGSGWDAASAEARCDVFSASATAEGADPATFLPAGCPSGATAMCTGMQDDMADPGTSITLYYYGTPLPVAKDACIDQGFTWTDL
jgi:hypothetical protein